MTTRPLLALPLVLAFALTMPSASAFAQASVRLEGSCERLVIAGQDVTASCNSTLTNAVSRSRTSFSFTTKDGRSLSFSGNGAPQERSEETDPLQPINLVIPGETGKDGVTQGPLVAVGACRFGSPQPGKTAIACEASSAKGRYEGTFVTDAKAPSSAPAR